MNRFYTYGSVEAIPYYNCSHKNFTEWEKTGQKRPYFGWPLVVFGVLVEFLYIPVIYFIFKTKLIRHPCYKIIVLLALIDMSATCCSCLITGSLLIVGAVFCMYPIFIYVSGLFVLNTWCMACATTISLFLNRVISIGFRKYADELEKKIAYISMCLVISYGSFVFWFTPSIIFNSVFMCWLADPLSEIVPSKEAAAMYKNTVQAWHNFLFVAFMFILFTIYFVLVKRLEEGQKSKASRAIFLQCSVICFFNTGGALVYNALAIVTPAPWILVFGQICWSCNHACPAVIYVTLNETIRREFLKLLFGARYSQKIHDTSTTRQRSTVQ